MQLRSLALLALLCVGKGSQVGKSDLSLVIASQDLPEKASTPFSTLEDAVPDVLKIGSKEINGIKASVGAYADNDDVESFS
eukprot:CAMPEP_0181471886 /NCGR_PEP_ID=MMETSP1110-20121109/39308_1 /TAXON_ID=174948 /ORGANISM="Symbiodinium sp., Strain CCMP421" /LENGTH=80 /DNA_ID=CAMNT_0023596923 /DNA_START=56 /DNA_END=298 /DNA_ORIENTATION=-